MYFFNQIRIGTKIFEEMFSLKSAQIYFGKVNWNYNLTVTDL